MKQLPFRSNPIVVASLLGMALTLSTQSLAADKEDQKGPPPALVVTAAVETAELDAPITLVGTTEPKHQAEVAAEISGLVEDISARQGSRVKKGDKLLQLRNVRQQLLLGEAKSRLNEVQTRLAKAEADTRRAEDLFEKKFISDEELQTRSTEKEALSKQVDQLQAAIKLIEDRLGRMTIRAPFTGQVVAEQTEIGQWLGEGDTALTLVDLSSVKVMVPVPEQQIARVLPGASVPVHFDALPQRTFTGTIAAIIPLANADARTFPVQIDVANPEGAILGNMLARATLQLGGKIESILVPKDALVPRPDGSGYVVKVVDGATEIVPVRILIGQNNQFAVTPLSGELLAGDRVVTRGNERLRPGQTVREAENSPQG